MMQKIQIKGMSCQHCVNAVKSALEELGMANVEVNLEGGTASFTPTTAFTEEQVRDAVDDAGFEVTAFA